MLDPDDSFFRKLVRDNVSGQLKVAPEHCAAGVLAHMGKPPFDVYRAFRKKFFALTQECGKEQYLVPYLMSSHPGSTVKDAVTLACYLKSEGYAPEQVQDFYPTPGTASTVMFYTGLDPFTMKPVYTPTDYHEKALCRALLQYNRPQNAQLVREALEIAGRTDLIGTGKQCLVPPARDAKAVQPRRTSTGAKQSSGKRQGVPPRSSEKKSMGGAQKSKKGKAGGKPRHGR